MSSASVLTRTESQYVACPLGFAAFFYVVTFFIKTFFIKTFFIMTPRVRCRYRCSGGQAESTGLHKLLARHLLYSSKSSSNVADAWANKALEVVRLTRSKAKTVMATDTVRDRIALVDPRKAYAQPPFSDQKKIDMPGRTSEMTPAPEHGEQTYRGSGKLQGLNALVTGGDSGIGRAIAICYAKEGANVAISYLNETEDARKTAECVTAAGRQAIVVEGDLRDEQLCRSLVDQVIEGFGGLDILINNAAFQATRDSIDEFSAELFDRIFKTNVYAPFWLCKAAMSHLPPGGSIINTASIQGYDPSASLLPYAATKSALLGMTKGLAKLAIEHGVRVNAVAPGPVWTPLIPGSMPTDKVEGFGSNTLFKRPAQPIELAPLYVWLASADASYVTGEVFGCTGGRTPV